MRNPARTARRAGVAVALVLLAGALVAEIHGHLQARLVLWIAAGVAGGPAVLHALLFAVPAAQARQDTATAQLPPTPAAIARGGRPPSPRRRELTS